MPLKAETRLAGLALMDDVDLLEQAFKTMHAGLYRYHTPAEIDLQFDALRARLQDGATLAETYLILAEFTASIRCGHTYLNFFNQPKAIVEALFQGTNRVPFEFRWLGGQMFITRNLSGNPALAPGTEVLIINGVAASEVLRRLMPLARADGSNDAKRRALLEVTGSDLYESFDIFYPLCFPLRSPHFELVVKPFGAATNATVFARPITDAERRAALHQPSENLAGGDAGWTFAWLNPRAALLRMPTWELYNSKWDWQAFLMATFAKLADAPGCALIIDLRDNEGGQDVGEVILRHLIRRELAVGAMPGHIRFRSVPKNLRPYLDTWDNSFLDWTTNTFKPAFQPAGQAVYYRMNRFDYDQGGFLKPLAPHFGGRVVIFMNAANSSATFNFEQLARQNGLAELIGTPSGGNRRGINGGAFFFLRLPHSQIEIDLPLIATLPTTPQPDAGLLPDQVVPTTPQGLAAGTDEVLRAALQWLHATESGRPK